MVRRGVGRGSRGGAGMRRARRTRSQRWPPRRRAPPRRWSAHRTSRRPRPGRAGGRTGTGNGRATRRAAPPRAPSSGPPRRRRPWPRCLHLPAEAPPPPGDAARTPAPRRGACRLRRLCEPPFQPVSACPVTVSGHSARAIPHRLRGVISPGRPPVCRATTVCATGKEVSGVRLSHRLPAFLLAAALAALPAAGCVRNPATGERQLSFFSEAQEIQMGREYDAQIVASLGLYPDSALQRYVQELGARLAAGSERPHLPWTFRVLDDPVVNAFALPGGYIYVTRGILAYLGSEAELASVLGHEI